MWAPYDPSCRDTNPFVSQWHLAQVAQRVAKFGAPTMSSPGIDRNYEHTNRRKAAQNLKFDDRHDVTVRFWDFIVIPSNHWPQKSHGLQPSLGLRATGPTPRLPPAAMSRCWPKSHVNYATISRGPLGTVVSVFVVSQKKTPVNITQDGPKPAVNE